MWPKTYIMLLLVLLTVSCRGLPVVYARPLHRFRRILRQAGKDRFMSNRDTSDEFIASSRVPQSMSELHQKEYQSSPCSMGLDDEDCVKSNSEFSGQWEENSGESEDYSSGSGEGSSCQNEYYDEVVDASTPTGSGNNQDGKQSTQDESFTRMLNVIHTLSSGGVDL